MWKLAWLVALAPICLAASVFETAAEPAAQNHVDELVFARLQQLNIRAAHPASDAVFLRRAFLGVTGTLPTAREATAFLADPSPTKRAELIDRLLDSESFADYQALRWSDLLRIKAEFPINLWPNAAQAYYHWLRAAIRENQPYDRFAYELLTSSGSNFRAPPVNFYRALQSRDPQSVARTVALTFMGVQAETWPAQRLADMAVFFSRIHYKETGEWKEEIVQPLFSGAPLVTRFPDGTPARIGADQDSRMVFAAWLIAPKNPWFARAVVDRVWFWLYGRNDDPEVSAYLADELVRARFDLRHIYHLILNSAVYQLSPVPRDSRPDAAEHFAYYPLRRLDGEVLIDALCQITGVPDTYSSAIPEPYTWMPEDQRAIALPDGSITSSFLELFGKPARDTGLESERSNQITDAQRLHLLNSSHILRKLDQGPAIQAIIRNNNRNPRELVSQLYLTILSRYPTPEEVAAVAAHAQTASAKGRDAAIDLAWSLINSTEFLYRH